LESQGLACVRLEVTLKLDPDGCDARAIALPAPTREVKTLLTLVRLELEARPPGAPVTGFAFTAHPDKPRRAQLSLFGPPALPPRTGRHQDRRPVRPPRIRPNRLPTNGGRPPPQALHNNRLRPASTPHNPPPFKNRPRPLSGASPPSPSGARSPRNSSHLFRRHRGGACPSRPVVLCLRGIQSKIQNRKARI